MLHKLVFPLMISVAVLAAPAHAQLGLPSLGSGKSAPASKVAVPDEAAQEALVQRFVKSQGYSLDAQASFAKALGLAEQVQLLEAEKKALTSGAVDNDTLKKTKEVSANVQKAIDEKQAAKPQLDAESKKNYTEGLVSLVESVLEAQKLGDEANSFSDGMKGAGVAKAATLASKLKSGMWVTKESPGYIKNLYDSTKQALSYAKANNISVPKNADKLDF